MNRMSDDQNTMLGLAECAFKLRIPYQDAHRLLLVGELVGEKRGKRWVVSSESLERLLRLRHARPSSMQQRVEVTDVNRAKPREPVWILPSRRP